MNRILIIAAHPDDDILGCGGYISKYSNDHKIRVVFIAEGTSCRYENCIDKTVLDEISKRNQYGINALKMYDFKVVVKREC